MWFHSVRLVLNINAGLVYSHNVLCVQEHFLNAFGTNTVVCVKSWRRVCDKDALRGMGKKNPHFVSVFKAKDIHSCVSKQLFSHKKMQIFPRSRHVDLLSTGLIVSTALNSNWPSCWLTELSFKYSKCAHYQNPLAYTAVFRQTGIKAQT